MKRYPILIIMAAFVALACQNSNSSKSESGETGTAAAESMQNAAIVLTVDGKTRTISAADREADGIVLDEYPIKTLFRTKADNRPFEINLNFYEEGILDLLPITYTLPEDNLNEVKIDLNFYDLEREVERNMQRRLVFDTGTITIHELGAGSIRFAFEGEVHELMRDENRSPVSGSVDVSY